jgi:hypothetical protein
MLFLAIFIVWIIAIIWAIISGLWSIAPWILLVGVVWLWLGGDKDESENQEEKRQKEKRQK